MEELLICLLLSLLKHIMQEDTYEENPKTDQVRSASSNDFHISILVKTSPNQWNNKFPEFLLFLNCFIIAYVNSSFK